jgi:hypothetical protein
MRANKFLDAKYGLDSIEKRRLKQSRVSDLNDPFELRSFDVTDFVFRNTFLETSKNVDENRGLLCFSANWKNPVIWAHYSDKHKGLCLGFEIPELTSDPQSETGKVDYVPDLLPCPTLADFETMTDAEHEAFSRKALFTKFAHWIYEEEIRVWGHLGIEEHGLYFVPFKEDMRLTEIIIGERSPLLRANVEKALGSLKTEVKIKRARAAYDKFEMVEDEVCP